MIQINIRSRHEAKPDDELGRRYCGWSEGLSPDEVYEAARGCWKLSDRANSEKFAVVVHRGLVRCVIEIDRIEPVSTGLRAIVGRPVAQGHPLHDRWTGEPAPSNRGGGSITYVDDSPS
jgi:hypothetical protein